MPTTTAVIKYVNPARDGRKPSVKSDDGTTYQCKDHQLAWFEQGRTYKIEYSGEREFNGKTYRNVESAAPVEMGGLGSTSSQTGAASPSVGHQGNGKDEQIFVCALLKELIRSGEIKNDKRQLWDATNMLRGLWRATFGDTNTFHASEAQQPRTARG